MLASNRSAVIRQVRQVAFEPKQFQDDVAIKFIVPMRIKDVRRKLLRADLTHRLVTQQSGEVLYDRKTDQALHGPIKDWELSIFREVGIRIDNAHYGEMDLDFSQAIWAEKNSIKSVFCLVKSHEALKDYHCGVGLTEVPEGTLVEYMVHIEVVEYAPPSYVEYIQNQVHNAATRSAENFKKAFLDVCQ